MSWLLIRFMLVMVPVVFLINGLTKGDWLTALTFSVAVAVGLTPEMLPMVVSSHVMEHGMVYPLDDERRVSLLQYAQGLNQEGFRVLLIATRIIPDGQLRAQYGVGDEAGLVICGFLGFLDPPKESAAPAIRALQDYGVTVKVLTGDNAIVTARVCRDVGLDASSLLSGSQIDQMDDAALSDAVLKTTVFAKLAPLQKARIVKCLQAHGHIVGFLGDGINDAPALRDADVGISVDGGTDIAKETADIILLEKSLLVLVASAWLPWDHMDEDFLRKPRKWDAGHIGRFMLWMGPTSSIFDITTYILLWTVFGAGAAFHLTGGDGGQAIMHTGWFMEGLISQTLVVHMLRTRKIPFIQSWASLPVLLTTSIAIVIGCWLPYSFMADSMGFTPLPVSYFYWLLATMIAYMTLTQTIKTLFVRRYGIWY